MKPAPLALAVLFSGSAMPPATHIVPARSPHQGVVIVPHEYVGTLLSACSEYHAPTWLVANLIAHESGWDDQAVNVNHNGTTDHGLMQLNSRWFDVRIAKDGRMAIRAGVYHLRHLYDVTGDWRLALVAYNAGLGALRSGQAPAASWQYAGDIFAGR